MTTYRKISELIIDRHYNGFPSDDATITIRHVAELVAFEVAKEVNRIVKQSAIESSNAGEAFFVNDQFVTVYNSLKLKTDDITGEKYVDMPAKTVMMPNNQEVSSVAFTAYPFIKLVPIKQKDTFAQNFLTHPKGIKNYVVEGDRIVFKNVSQLTNGNVSVKLTGVLPGDMLLDAELSLPKDSEATIMDNVLLKLNPRLTVPRDVLNDSQTQTA